MNFHTGIIKVELNDILKGAYAKTHSYRKTLKCNLVSKYEVSCFINYNEIFRLLKPFRSLVEKNWQKKKISVKLFQLSFNLYYMRKKFPYPESIIHFLSISPYSRRSCKKRSKCSQLLISSLKENIFLNVCPPF